jgi:spore coat protein U-like protein
MYKKLISACICGVAASFFVFGAANASTASGSFQVTLTIQGTCAVTSAATLAFGTQTAIASALNSTSAIGVTCTNGTPYTIGLNAGTGSGATVAARLLTSGSTTVPYSIYQDSGHTQVWGNTTGTNTEASTGTGALQTFTAYGQLPAVASPTVGSYTDTVSVTVTY